MIVPIQSLKVIAPIRASYILKVTADTVGVIGSGYGKDARVLSAGYHYQTYDGISWSGHLYLANYYDTAGNSEQSWQAKAEHRRPFFNGLLSLQLRYLDQSPLLPEGADEVAAATTWEYRF